MNNRDKSIMLLFKSYLVDCYKEGFNPCKRALKNGILINSKCSKDIKDLAIEIWGVDGFLLNQTFHKSLGTVLNSSIQKLYIDQIMHYMTTYGYEELGIYSNETIFIPYEKIDIPKLNNDIKLINITPITKKDLEKRLLSLLESSIPLSRQTILCISDLIDYLDINEDNIKNIKNKEIKNIIYDKLNIVPKENVEFIRYLIYKLTNKTLLIKDDITLGLLKVSNKDLALSLIESYNDLGSLSEIFNRFKPFFLALKSEDNKELNRVINTISKLSKKYHKPFKNSDLDNFIIWYKNNYKSRNYKELLSKLLDKESIWRIIKLRNYIELINSGIHERMYKIRNGRTWACINDKSISINSFTTDYLDSIIINKLKRSVNGKKVYFDDNLEIVIPQSEKQFVGNIPFASSIKINKDDLLVGINWFNVDDKRVDLDLKIISNEYSIGWDVGYKEGDKLLFSGDVTSAPFPNGASEYIYISKDIGKTIFSLKVNNFTSSVDNVSYDLIIAKKSKEELVNNYIVDPKDIIIRIPKIMVELGKSEVSLGNIVVEDDYIKLIFTDLSTSNRITSSNNNIEEIIRDYLNEEHSFKCKLNDYLEKAGAVITKDESMADFDFSIDSISKDSIINILK